MISFKPSYMPINLLQTISRAFSILICEIQFFVIEGPLVQGDDIAIKKYNLTTPVITRGYENNPDIFAKRQNSYAERRIMVFCRQIVGKEKTTDE